MNSVWSCDGSEKVVSQFSKLSLSREAVQGKDCLLLAGISGTPALYLRNSAKTQHSNRLPLADRVAVLKWNASSDLPARLHGGGPL